MWITVKADDHSSVMFNTVLTHYLCFLLLSGLAYLQWDSLVGSIYLYFSGLVCMLYICFQLATYVDNNLPRFRVTATRKAVFITGCDRGFGRLLARRLDSMGYKVFAGCLDPSSPDVQQLTDTVSNSLVTVPLDVTCDNSVQKALETVKNNLGENELWALVNNAGVLERGELEWTGIDKFQMQFEVNTFGVVRVTQAFLPLIRKTQGRVVTVASVGGRITFSGFVPYCMSKHAVISFCDGLRLEMKKFGVKVITIEPFSYQTSMTETNTALQSVRDTWQKNFTTRHSGKDVYDETYLLAFSDTVRKFCEATTIADTRRAVDLMVEGVCATSPHYSYLPGDAPRLLNLWLSRHLPKTIVDLFVRENITFDVDMENFLKSRRKNS